MKRIIVFLIVVCFLGACKEEEPGATNSNQFVGTWRVVTEKSLPGYEEQSDNNGITTDWELENPFGGGLSVTSIKFNEDKTFFWNADKIDDWDHFLTLWNDLPVDRRNTYSVSDDFVTLHTPFEYVGIIKVSSIDFKTSMVDAGHLILENDDVRLTFVKTDL